LLRRFAAEDPATSLRIHPDEPPGPADIRRSPPPVANLIRTS
jgi:hypothetical protein